MFFSKSKYCGFYQCPKITWLNKNKPEEYVADVQALARMASGNELGDLGRWKIGNSPNGDMKHQTGEIVDDQKLDHQRRAPDDPNKQVCNDAQGLEAGHGPEHDDEPQGNGPQQGNAKKPQGLQKADI